jgi:methionyl aminopeptidase
MNMIKTPEEIEIMRTSGRILAESLAELRKLAVAGVTTLELDSAAEELIIAKGGKPAFKGYEDFPYALCTSVNQNVVHGLPSEYVLQEGDVVKLDLGVKYQGFNTDSAITVIVGEGSPEAQELVRVTERSLILGIEQARAGKTAGHIGQAIQEYIERHGYGIVRELCGHGIGRSIHEDPQILNYGKAGKGELLKEGMVICIEPMVTLGGRELAKSKDGYGYRSRDNSLTAHVEHTIAITAKGAEVLTQLPSAPKNTL